MRVLIVDDSRAMRMILKKIMTVLGFEVLEAGNGLQALDLLGQVSPPELALLDMNMPEMNGLEFVKAVRAKPEYGAVKLVVVSSETQTEGVEMMEKAGADGFITKPFTLETLDKKLKSLGLLGN